MPDKWIIQLLSLQFFLCVRGYTWDEVAVDNKEEK